ncbi:MAG: WG repeat-containing protein [Bacteroidales bacterium]|nr:WG repeat-containing protein [Bacteroidales bacterium]
MKRFLLLLALAWTTVAFAQDESEPQPPSWINVSKLAFVASHGTDRSNAPIQYLMFAEKTYEDNEELFNQLISLLDEIGQEEMNQAVPETIKQMDEDIKQLKETLKDNPNPEIQAALKEMIREFEQQKKDAMADYVKPSVSYSYDPAAMYRRLKALAINQKVYSGYWEAGNGLYSVTEVPRYCNLDEDDRYTHTKITFAEEDRYKWGLIDENGRQILPYKYGSVNVHHIYPDAFPELDLIFMYKQDPDGSVHAGAVNYRGQVRIPFIYDDQNGVYHGEDIFSFSKNGKFGLVNVKTGREVLPFEYTTFSRMAGGWLVSKDDEHYGMVSIRTGKVIIPLKYQNLWDDADPSFLTFDGKIDYYDDYGHLVRTENAPTYDD